LDWHDLRHEGACRLLGDGVNIRIIQLMLATSDVKTTQRYPNITPKRVAEDADRRLGTPPAAEGSRRVDLAELPADPERWLRLNLQRSSSASRILPPEG
jgi:hypothetical protein